MRIGGRRSVRREVSRINIYGAAEDDWLILFMHNNYDANNAISWAHKEDRLAGARDQTCDSRAVHDSEQLP